MADPEPAPAGPPAAGPARGWPWRQWLRAIHRDLGFFAVGFTVIYAVSGVAVNHIADWDPSFDRYRVEHDAAARLPDTLPEDADAAAAVFLRALGIAEAPRSVHASTRPLVRYEVELSTGGLLDVRPDEGVVIERRPGDPPAPPARRTPLGAPLPAGDLDAGREVLRRLAIDDPKAAVYRVDRPIREFEIVLERRTLRANEASGIVTEEGERPRLLLRAANWLHLNRGKRAWTYVADAYAAALLLLAGSGVLMLRGRAGLLGRGGILTALGIAIPVAYVVLFGPG